jgi:hypothetical protein
MIIIAYFERVYFPLFQLDRYIKAKIIVMPIVVAIVNLLRPSPMLIIVPRMPIKADMKLNTRTR